MPEQHIQLGRPLRNATLCAFDQLGQILQDAEARANKARAETSEDVTQLLSRIADGLAAAKLKTDPVARELGSLAIALAKMMVKKLVGNSDELQAKRLSQVLLEALSRPEPAIGVFINPANLTAIRSHMQNNDSLQGIQLHADETLHSGECRVDFDTHSLVSSLEQQMDEIESRLQELIDND